MTSITFAVFCFFRSKLVCPVLPWSELQTLLTPKFTKQRREPRVQWPEATACPEKDQSLFPQPSSAGLKAPCLSGAASHYHWDSIQIQSTGEVRTSDYHNTMKYSWLLNNLEFRAPGENLLVTLHLALCIQGFTAVDSTNCRLVHIYWKHPGTYGPVLFKPVSFKG